MTSKIKNEIEKVETFAKMIRKLEFFNFNHEELLEGVTWKQFIENFFSFTSFNSLYHTTQVSMSSSFSQTILTEDQVLQRASREYEFCRLRKARSLLDMYRITINYYPKVSLIEFMAYLYEMYLQQRISTFICFDISKRIFHQNCRWGRGDFIQTRYNPLIRKYIEMCDELGFYKKHYEQAYLLYKKLNNDTE